MTKTLTTKQPPSSEIIEKVMMAGDLSGLTPDQRLGYYKSVCETLGLNPLTKPFDYITLDGKLVLYARKDCTEQLRKRYEISCKVTHREQQESIYIVTAQASLPNGRVDESIGAVGILEPERIKRWNQDKSFTWIANPKAGQVIPAADLANAVMKSETKAKRRVTLSICGLGIMDESEIEHVTNGNEFDQRTPNEIAERNVREATANAGGELSESVTLARDAVVVDKNGNVTHAEQVVGPYGPKVVTADNYKERISHVGKAEGRILGRKVGEMEPPVIKWMYEKWRNSLQPSATDDDMQLKKAIEFAHAELSRPDGEAGSQPGEKATTVNAEPAHSDSGAKQAAITDLRERIEKLVITEADACRYLVKFGLFDASMFQPGIEPSFNDVPEGMLLYLCQPGQWKLFVTLYEKEVKPKVSATIPAKRGRKKK